jgi:hypothetical protein
MISEITIKISFASEGGEVCAGVTGVTVEGAQILPPEAPREAASDQIPAPPAMEDVLSEVDETIPPPLTSAQSGSDISVPDVPEEVLPAPEG